MGCIRKDVASCQLWELQTWEHARRNATVCALASTSKNLRRLVQHLIVPQHKQQQQQQQEA